MLRGTQHWPKTSNQWLMAKKRAGNWELLILIYLIVHKQHVDVISRKGFYMDSRNIT